MAAQKRVRAEADAVIPTSFNGFEIVSDIVDVVRPNATYKQFKCANGQTFLVTEKQLASGNF